MHLSLKRLSAALVFVGASFMPGWAREAAFTCPAGFIPKEGLNTNFPSDGLMRAFVVTPAQGVTGPAPAWVSNDGIARTGPPCDAVSLNAVRRRRGAISTLHGVTFLTGRICDFSNGERHDFGQALNRI
jgi:hypothetical protein